MNLWKSYYDEYRPISVKSEVITVESEVITVDTEVITMDTDQKRE